MANGLLGSIINPAQADVLGALDQGRERQATDLAGELLGQTIGGKIGDLARLSPDKALKFAEATGTPVSSQGRIKNLIGINVIGAKLLQAGQLQEAAQFLDEEASKVESLTGEPAARLRTVQQAILNGDQETINNFIQAGLSLDPTKTQGRSAGQRERSDLLADLASDDPVIAKSASIALGLSPRAVGSASQTIAGTGKAEEVAASEATIAEQIAGAKVTGAAKAKAKSSPLIAKTESFINTQIKLAESAAKEKGEVLTDLSRAQAALPGLTEVVTKLRDLAPIATSTFGGRVWDTAVKELGFGATKGATASAKFGAMVNNQVLPLLKPTFGAAFTVQEGESLRATMGDVNASVEEKMATLDAFIEQKQRDIDTKQLQIDSSPSPNAPTVTTQAQFDALQSGDTYTQENGEVFIKP